jgi:hypothetical protein
MIRSPTLAIKTKFSLSVLFPDSYVCFLGNGTISMYENTSDFSAPLSKSYRCVKVQSFSLRNEGNETAGVIELSHVQLEAFHKKMDDSFGAG